MSLIGFLDEIVNKHFYNMKDKGHRRCATNDIKWFKQQLRKTIDEVFSQPPKNLRCSNKEWFENYKFVLKIFKELLVKRIFGSEQEETISIPPDKNSHSITSSEKTKD